jgi:hypothetical protein
MSIIYFSLQKQICIFMQDNLSLQYYGECFNRAIFQVKECNLEIVLRPYYFKRDIGIETMIIKVQQTCNVIDCCLCAVHANHR